MKLTIENKEVEIASVVVLLPVRYGDECIPYDFPLRNGDIWKANIDIETGKIIDWPEGKNKEFFLYLKVVDEGVYELRDQKGNSIAGCDGYVPHGVIPGEYGDYVDFEIQNGVIRNWPEKINAEKFSLFPK